MSISLIALLVIITVLLFTITFLLYHYVSTLPTRRINKEILRREKLLYLEKLKAERFKQNARNAGADAIENINKIAKLK